MSAGGVVERHLASLQWRNLRASTITQRRNALRRLERWTESEPVACSAEEIVDWLSRHDNANTKAAEMAHLRGFFKWCVREGLRVDNPMERIDRPKLRRGVPHPIPEDDLHMALELAPLERIRPWLYLGAYAGLRACECSPLLGEDILWNLEPVLLLIRESKGGDEQYVPLAPILLAVLRALPRKGLLFPRKDGRPGPLPAWNVSQRCNAFLHSIGIPYTFHSLRHRFGTEVYRASGRDLRQAQELLRHRSPVSTSIYTAVVPTEGAATVSALPVH